MKNPDDNLNNEHLHVLFTWNFWIAILYYNVRTPTSLALILAMQDAPKKILLFVNQGDFDSYPSNLMQ